jgi:DeoR family transcriptional regulator, aga operon transcriptional repressor
MSEPMTAELTARRRRRLVALLREQGLTRVTELASRLGVSASTVRRDLADLQQQGVIVRVHGGAGTAQDEFAVDHRVSDDRAGSKRAIARAAAELVPHGATIMLLAGSTVAAMVPFLGGRRDLHVVTSGLDIAHAVAHQHRDVAVTVLGGQVHRDQMTMIGLLSEQNMRAVHVDLMFGGVWGIDARTGVTGPKLVQAAERRHLLEHAAELVVLADGTKFGRTGPALLATVDQIGHVFTDADAPPDEVAGLRAAGVHVEICE